MPTVYEIVESKQRMVLKEIERKWGEIRFDREPDPEDDPSFRFYDKLMREKPRKGA